MTVSHTTALDLLGKYVSFHVLNHARLDFEGLVSSVVLEFDGSHHIRLGFDDCFFLSDIKDLKVLGELHLYSD